MKKIKESKKILILAGIILLVVVFLLLLVLILRKGSGKQEINKLGQQITEEDETSGREDLTGDETTEQGALAEESGEKSGDTDSGSGLEVADPKDAEREDSENTVEFVSPGANGGNTGSGGGTGNNGNTGSGGDTDNSGSTGSNGDGGGNDGNLDEETDSGGQYGEFF